MNYTCKSKHMASGKCLVSGDEYGSSRFRSNSLVSTTCTFFLCLKGIRALKKPVNQISVMWFHGAVQILTCRHPIYKPNLTRLQTTQKISWEEGKWWSSSEERVCVLKQNILGQAISCTLQRFSSTLFSRVVFCVWSCNSPTSRRSRDEAALMSKLPPSSLLGSLASQRVGNHHIQVGEGGGIIKKISSCHLLCVVGVPFFSRHN